MTPISLRTLMRRTAHRTALTAVVVVLAGLVVAHHGLPTDMHAMRGAVVCLAIATAAITVAVAGAPGVLPQRIAPRSLPSPSAAGAPAVRGVPARAGPIFLRLQVVRR